MSKRSGDIQTAYKRAKAPKEDAGLLEFISNLQKLKDKTSDDIRAKAPKEDNGLLECISNLQKLKDKTSKNDIQTAYKRAKAPKEDDGLLEFISNLQKLKDKTAVLSSYLVRMQKFRPDMVLLYGKLGFQGKGYFIVISPVVAGITSQRPFLNIEVDVLFEDIEIKMDLFDVTGIVGHHSSDCNTLECSDLIPIQEWCNVHAQYAETLLPLLELEARKQIETPIPLLTEEKAQDLRSKEIERYNAWKISAKAIGDGLSAKFPGVEINESEQGLNLFIPLPTKLEDMKYKIEVQFIYTDARFDDDTRCATEYNFVNVCIHYLEKGEDWKKLDMDVEFEDGFGFIPLYLLKPEKAFDIFMTHFKFILISAESMCKKHLE